MNLDTLYGTLEGPEDPPWIKPHERLDGSTIANPTLRVVAMPGGRISLDHSMPELIWLIDADGSIRIAEEVKVGEDSVGRALRLGHPTLVDGAPARIAGELSLELGNWTINDKSGRYTTPYKYLGTRTDTHLINAAKLFAEAGVNVAVKPFP